MLEIYVETRAMCPQWEIIKMSDRNILGPMAEWTVIKLVPNGWKTLWCFICWK